MLFSNIASCSVSGLVHWKTYYTHFLLAKGYEEAKAKKHVEDYDEIQLDSDGKILFRVQGLLSRNDLSTMVGYHVTMEIKYLRTKVVSRMKARLVAVILVPESVPKCRSLLY